ncbi:hypothetical protein EAO70_02685, partial [Streptomyces sp. adm13(2018)]|uniref:asparagine synthase-related protein n=1 Tax=Streptomyces sp. adm13(2018) TaxID=2479007 RepID=UPI0013A2101D
RAPVHRRLPGPREHLYTADYRAHIADRGSAADRIEQELRSAEAVGEDRLTAMTAFETRWRLPAYHLRRVDHLSMAWAVEARMPFCQPAVVTHTRALPTAARTGKRALYEAGAELLPPAVLRRPKQPFTLPLSAMLAPGGPLLETVRELLSPARLVLGGKVRADRVQRLLTRHGERLYTADYRAHIADRGSAADRIEQELRSAEAVGEDRLTAMTAFETRWRLPAYHLRRVDHLSMAWAVEARMPFCQPAVVTHTRALPTAGSTGRPAHRPPRRPPRRRGRRGALPTGRPVDLLDGVPVSLVRYGNPYVLVDTRHLPEDGLRERLEDLRAHAARLLGHPPHSALPKIAAFTAGPAGLSVRALTVGGWHPRLALTGAAALAAAGALDGTVVPPVDGEVRTPGGTVTVSTGPDRVRVHHKRAELLDRLVLPWRVHATA